MGAAEPGCFEKLTRYAFIGFNILFTIFGLALVIAGSVGVAKINSADIKKMVNELTEIDDKLIDDAVKTTLVGVAAVVIFIGLVTMAMSSCGWLGACKQNSCLLFTFAVSMVIIVVVEFIIGITVLVVVKKYSDPDNEEHKVWKSELVVEAEREYANKEKHSNLTATYPIISAWDAMQKKWKLLWARWARRLECKG